MFFSPTLKKDIAAGKCVRTIEVTAGDDGYGAAYWQGRETGLRAAYAKVAGVPNTWTSQDAGIPGHPIALYTLTGKPTMSVAFLQLPDGNLGGEGFPSTGEQSLEQLWMGYITSIDAIDGSSKYTRARLLATLTQLIDRARPN